MEVAEKQKEKVNNQPEVAKVAVAVVAWWQHCHVSLLQQR